MSDFWIGPDSTPDTYELISLLGGGGEGEVWRANLQLSDAGRRAVAVKLLPSSGSPDEADAWQRAGHLLSSLAHPGLVRVTDTFIAPRPHRLGEVDPNDRTRVVVMDFIEGPTVREWVDENPDASAATRLALLRTVASALDEMHSGRRTEVAVAHGDVKPANIIVSQQGGTVLVDLGLTRLADAAGEVGRSNPYAAPELRGAQAQATPEADAYAFAVTLAQVLVGAPPPTDTQGFLDLEALRAQLAAAPATRNRPQLVQQVMGVVTAAPEQRPRALRAWLDATVDTLSQVTSTGVLDEVVALPPEVPPGAAAPSAAAEPAPARKKRTRLVVAAAIVLLLIGGGGAYAALRGKSDDPSGGKTAGTSTAPTKSESPTPTPTPTESPTPSPTGSPTPTPSGTPSGLPSNTQVTTTQWVGDLQPVDESDGEWDADGFQTNGKLYPHSVSLQPNCYASNGGDYWVEYDLARSWTELKGVAGLNDDSPSSGRMTWKIFGDGKVLQSGSNNLGTSTPISLKVAGVLRLRILVHDDQVIDDCPDPQSSMIFGNLELGV